MTAPGGHPQEQAAIELLGQRLGAQVIAVAPAPLFEPPLHVEPIEVPVTGSVTALCCGGWIAPDGGFITCTNCPGRSPELFAPLVDTCGAQFCGADGGACPECGLTADDLAADPRLREVAERLAARTAADARGPACANPWCRGEPGGGCGRTPNEHLEAGVTLDAVLAASPDAQRAVILGREEAMRQTDPALALWAPAVVEEGDPSCRYCKGTGKTLDSQPGEAPYYGEPCQHCRPGDDPLSGPQSDAPAGGAPTDRQPENATDASARPAGAVVSPDGRTTEVAELTPGAITAALAAGELPLPDTPENRERLRAAVELRDPLVEAWPLAAPLADPAAAPLVREPAVAGGVVLRAPASSPPADTEPLRIELTEAVMSYCLNDPRTLQTAIGPSEIGHPCDARIMRRVLDLPKVNDRADPWASFVGQAVHAKLADVFEWVNGQPKNGDGPQGNYIVERKVYVVGDGTAEEDIGGSCDLMRDGLVIDHKIVGNDSMRELKSAGWDAKGGIYTVQLDLYGLGYERAGHKIREVALAAWPRSGFLHGLFILRRPYDRGRAEQALARLGRLADEAVQLNAAENNAAWQDLIATAPSKQCAFCPWYDPERAVPDGRGGYSPRADVTACGFGRKADKHRGAL